MVFRQKFSPQIPKVDCSIKGRNKKTEAANCSNLKDPFPPLRISVIEMHRIKDNFFCVCGGRPIMFLACMRGKANRSWNAMSCCCSFSWDKRRHFWVPTSLLTVNGLVTLCFPSLSPRRSLNSFCSCSAPSHSASSNGRNYASFFESSGKRTLFLAWLPFFSGWRNR